MSYGVKPPGYRLPAATRLGTARLQVADLQLSAAWYRDVLGLRISATTATSVALSSDGGVAPILELHERRGVRAVPPGGLLGLFHFAILLRDRQALGRLVRHLVEARVRFASADHLVSEAIYLWDPDNLGVEVYADRPQREWRTNGAELMMATDPLDLESLVKAAGAAPWAGMPAGTTLGHMHLSVGDLPRAKDCFHAALGFDTVVWSYPGALFMSAGGYHHHLGTNTWSARARAATEDDARLLEWELVLPHAADVDEAAASLRNNGYVVAADGAGVVVTDPWGTPLRLTSG